MIQKLNALERIRFFKKSDSKIVDLRSTNLESVPEQLFTLDQCEILNLGGNRLTNVPEGILNMKSLNTLLLHRNEFEYIPDVIYRISDLISLNMGKNKLKRVDEKILKLKKLRKLYLSNNLIDEYPLFLSELTSLQELSLRKNQINYIPSEIVRFVNLRSLSVVDNPILNVPTLVLNKGTDALFAYFELKSEMKIDIIKFNIQLSAQIKTAIKQYLDYFNDFTRISKGLDFQIEVKTTNNGLSIEVPITKNSNELGEYLNEYLSFIKLNAGDIKPNIETSLSNNEKNILLLELRNQIRFLHTSIEIREIKNQELTKSIEFFKLLLLEERKKQNPIMIQASIKNEVNNEFNQNIKQVYENFEEKKLVNEIENLKKELLSDKEVDLKLKNDILFMLKGLETEANDKKISKRVIDNVIEKTSQISSVGSFLSNIIKILNGM